MPLIHIRDILSSKSCLEVGFVQADNEQNRSRIRFILQWLKHAADRLTTYNSEIGNAEISSTTLRPYDPSFLG